MSQPTLNAERSNSSASDGVVLSCVLIIAAVLRVGLIVWRPDSLLQDRDLYWGIAERLAAGDGFQHPTLGHATAYRPPLYPLILAQLVGLGCRTTCLALLQTTFSIATVWLTWSLGRKLELGRGSVVAAAFVAINPLLVLANSQAMTETFCGFFLIASMRVIVSFKSESIWESDLSGALATLGIHSEGLAPPRRWTALKLFALGVLCGLGALTRPTVFAFVGVAAIIEIGSALIRGLVTRTYFGNALIALAAFGLIVAPWGFRNWHVFGHPIVTTTHGGYTLLLGNNDEAYRSEVEQPFGTLWDSRPWQQNLQQEMSAAGLAPTDEVARDRHQSEKAWTWIRQHPREFMGACWLRFRRFWNVLPFGADAESLPSTVRRGIALFYVIELLLASMGLCCLRKSDMTQWWPIVVLIASFSAVHLIYWSNLRMRAPVEPALALLAGFALVRCRRNLANANKPR